MAQIRLQIRIKPSAPSDVLLTQANHGMSSREYTLSQQGEAETEKHCLYIVLAECLMPEIAHSQCL